MSRPVALFANNAMICSYCGWNFYVAGGEITARHPTYEDYQIWNVEHHANTPLSEALQSCPNAGKTYRLPVCEEVDE